MTPEADDYIHSARHHLAKAAAGVADEAARVAYLAGFNAAQAFIFIKKGRAVKTHRGLRATFAKLAQGEPLIDPSFASFLGRAYSLKERTDYGIGDQPDVTDAEAEAMIDTAERLIDCIAKTLASEP